MFVAFFFDNASLGRRHRIDHFLNHLFPSLASKAREFHAAVQRLGRPTRRRQNYTSYV
jgi:hypothetical protein